jgi:hypothetical protein
MKKIKLFLGIIGLFIILNSCSDDNNSNGNHMRVFGKGTYETATSKAGNLNTPNDVVIHSFKINATELTLKYFIASDVGGGDNGEQGRDDGNNYESVTVFGPWELDLLHQTVKIASVPVPNGTYKKAELKLSKSLKPSSSIYNKTVEITGTVNGTPFVFWHDFEQTLLLRYEDDFETVIINNNSFDMIFAFNLNTLLDSIDLSEAVDGDGDGTIEIGPDDTDGNNALALLLDQHIGGCGGIEHHYHQ